MYLYIGLSLWKGLILDNIFKDKRLFMIKSYCFSIFVFLLINLKLFSQNPKIKEDCLLFRDAKTNKSILIIEDSIQLDLKTQKRSKLKHTSYPGKLIHYKCFNIKDKTYLVHDGCGPVLEFRNDSIVRIDNSSLHQNQCSAVSFVYNNEIYFFGGYGLFTFKNILTKFNFKTKEWYSVQTFGHQVPTPRSAALGILIKDNLYIFGGNEENPDDFHGFKKCKNIIWKLHLPSKTWENIGEYQDQLSFDKLLYFNIKNKLLCFDGSTYSNVYEIDLLNNSIKKYKPSLILKPLQINYNSFNNELEIINNQYSNLTYNYLSINLKDFKGKLIDDKSFIISSYNLLPNSNVLFIILFIFLILFFGIKFKNKLKYFKGLVFDPINKTFYFKGKQITVFEETELRILIYLIENSNRFISLTELNKLFENSLLIENFATTIKRRENSVNGLFLKLTLLTGLKENELLINRKNPEDKRIKEVRINPIFFKMK